MKTALMDKPYTLIVIDDVRSAQVVSWLDHLNVSDGRRGFRVSQGSPFQCRVFVTTRNVLLFDSVSADMKSVEIAKMRWESLGSSHSQRKFTGQKK